MRAIMITIFLLMAIGSGMAAEKQPAKDASKKPEAAAGEKHSGQKTADKKSTVQWPRPYKSTEEVSADSMVPFPTDI